MDYQSKNNNQQPNLDSRSKYAIASLVLIGINVIVTVGFFGSLKYLYTHDAPAHLYNTVSGIVLFWLFLAAPLLFLITLFLGISGLKSTKRRNIAVVGIILSVIGLFGCVFYFFLTLAAWP